MNKLHQKIITAENQINRVILGKENVVEEVLLAFLANGHVLLEDIPGVGKTTLALAFAGTIGLDSKRVQFTPDVMPTDLTGFSIYSRRNEEFVFQPGSVFCNLLLADELNRTSPKTQSALLEVMEEGKVSVEGITRQIPQPFLTIATQNPYGSAGTQMLPEAQIDRFLISLSMGYPDFEQELLMAKEIGNRDRIQDIIPVMNRQELLEAQKAIHSVYINDEVYRYLLSLIIETRNHPDIERGVSPRATIALVKMAKAYAWKKGRNYVVPRDIKTQYSYVVNHRLELFPSARMQGIEKEDVIRQILRKIKAPVMSLRGNGR